MPLISLFRKASTGKVWSLSKDFKPVFTDNNEWSYGRLSGTSESTLVLTKFNVLNTPSQWSPSSVSRLSADASMSYEPSITHNHTSSPVNLNGVITIPAGKICMHPNNLGMESCARWTCPKAGMYNIVASRFNINGLATTAVKLRKNLSVIWGSLNLDDSFSTTLSLVPGDKIDICVNMNGDYASDATGVDLVITEL